MCALGLVGRGSQHPDRQARLRCVALHSRCHRRPTLRGPLASRGAAFEEEKRVVAISRISIFEMLWAGELVLFGFSPPTSPSRAYASERTVTEPLQPYIIRVEGSHVQIRMPMVSRAAIPPLNFHLFLWSSILHVQPMDSHWNWLPLTSHDHVRHSRRRELCTNQRVEDERRVFPRAIHQSSHLCLIHSFDGIPTSTVVEIAAQITPDH